MAFAQFDCLVVRVARPLVFTSFRTPAVPLSPAGYSLPLEGSLFHRPKGRT